MEAQIKAGVGATECRRRKAGKHPPPAWMAMGSQLTQDGQKGMCSGN